MNKSDSYFYILGETTRMGVSRGMQQAYLDDTNLYSDDEYLRKYQVAKLYFDKYPGQNMYFENDFFLYSNPGAKTQYVSEKLKSILSAYNQQAFLKFNELPAIIGDKPKKYYKLEANRNIETVLDQNKTTVIFYGKNKEWSESKYEEVFRANKGRYRFIKPIFKPDCAVPNIFLLNQKLVVHKSVLDELISSNALNISATSRKTHTSIKALYDRNYFTFIERNVRKANLIVIQESSNFDAQNLYLPLRTLDKDKDSDFTKTDMYELSEKAVELFNAYNFEKTIQFKKAKKGNRFLIVDWKDIKELVDQQKSIYTLKWSNINNKEAKSNYDAVGSLQDIKLMAENFSRIYEDRVYSIVVTKPMFKKGLQPIHFYIEDDQLRASYSFYKILVEQDITGFASIVMF